MSKELKLPLNEMLKEQERIAIKAIVATAKSTITDTGTNLKATLNFRVRCPRPKKLCIHL